MREVRKSVLIALAIGLMVLNGRDAQSVPVTGPWYPVLVTRGGTLYIVGLEGGTPDGLVVNLVLQKKAVSDSQWSRQSFRLPVHLIGRSAEAIWAAPISAALTPTAILFVSTVERIGSTPVSNPIYRWDLRSQELRLIDPPEGSEGFYGMVSYGNRLYTVAEPPWSETMRAFRRKRRPRGRLYELTTRGMILRSTEIPLNHPIEHAKVIPSGFVPMATVGSRLFVMQNPGITSEVPGKGFELGAQLQVVDLRKLQLVTTVELPGMSSILAGYTLFGGEDLLYVKEIGPDNPRVFAFEPSLERIVMETVLDSRRSDALSFAVIGKRVFVPTASGLVEVGRFKEGAQID